VRFKHVVRNLVDYATESLWQHLGGRLGVKKNGEMLELTVSGAGVPGFAEAGGSSPEENCGHPKGVVSLTRLELIKEHVEFLKGHVHVVSRAGDVSDITVCLPCE